MSSNEVWARCGNCGTELKQGDKQCPICGSTKKAYKKEVSVALGLSVSVGGKHKRKGRGTLREWISNRWKRSGDPKLKNGVREDRVIDREKDWYDQVVKDAKTGETIHEEHEPLSKHKGKSL